MPRGERGNVCDELKAGVEDAVALDAVDDIFRTLLRVERATDDVVPFELDMFAILRSGFRTAARLFLEI